MRLFPFISQIEAWPVLVFCHRMSERPSLLKSPVPTACQASPGLGVTGPPPMRLFPLISQIEAWPVFTFCHRMLEWVSLALNWPVPTARQLGPGLGLTGPPPTRVFPSISQIEAWPLVFCQTMLLMIGVTGGGVAKPLPVISNAVPLLSAPPVSAVPKRLPLASATKLAPRPRVVLPWKLWTITG